MQAQFGAPGAWLPQHAEPDSPAHLYPCQASTPASAEPVSQSVHQFYTFVTLKSQGFEQTTSRQTFYRINRRSSNMYTRGGGGGGV